jgi:pimeloyl-ACP methyl ester carboxylesterase
LKTPQSLKDYDSLEGVAQRLRKTNPRLAPERATWLAQHWSQQGKDGRWQILGDAAHKRMSALPYRVDETLATWRAIQAPVLWVEGDLTDLALWWGERYSHAEFDARLAVVAQVERQRLSPCGHMLHHDQPAALAAHVGRFLT